MGVGASGAKGRWFESTRAYHIPKRVNPSSLYFFPSNLPSNFGYAERFRCGICASFAGPNSSLSSFSTRALLLGRDCFQVVPLRGFDAGVPELALGRCLVA